MINTFEFLAIIYMIMGFMVAINFVCVEKEKKTAFLGIVILVGIIVMFLWPFYLLYSNNDNDM